MARDTSVQSVLASHYVVVANRLRDVDPTIYVATSVQHDAHAYVAKNAVYPSVLRTRVLTSIAPRVLVDHGFTRYHHHCQLYSVVRETLETVRACRLFLGTSTNGGYPFQAWTSAALGIEGWCSTILGSATERR